MLGFNVFAADTHDEAAYRASSMQQAFINLRSGRPSAVAAAGRGLHRPHRAAGEGAARAQSCRARRSARPRHGRDIAAGVHRAHRRDELMLTSQIHDHAARLRSYEITADVLSEATRPERPSRRPAAARRRAVDAGGRRATARRSRSPSCLDEPFEERRGPGAADLRQSHRLLDDHEASVEQRAAPAGAARPPRAAAARRPRRRRASATNVSTTAGDVGRADELRLPSAMRVRYRSYALPRPTTTRMAGTIDRRRSPRSANRRAPGTPLRSARRARERDRRPRAPDRSRRSRRRHVPSATASTDFAGGIEHDQRRRSTPSRRARAPRARSTETPSGRIARRRARARIGLPRLIDARNRRSARTPATTSRPALRRRAHAPGARRCNRRATRRRARRRRRRATTGPSPRQSRAVVRDEAAAVVGRQSGRASRASRARRDGGRPADRMPRNGRDSGVATVPGCSATITAPGFVRATSIAAVRHDHVQRRLRRAVAVPAAEPVVLDAADLRRQQRDDRSIVGEQRRECRSTRAGPNVLTRNVAISCAYVQVGEPLLGHEIGRVQHARPR